MLTATSVLLHLPGEHLKKRFISLHMNVTGITASALEAEPESVRFWQRGPRATQSDESTWDSKQGERPRVNITNQKKRRENRPKERGTEWDNEAEEERNEKEKKMLITERVRGESLPMCTQVCVCVCL